MPGPLAGIKNRNVSREATFALMPFSFYVYKPSPQTVVAGSDSETYNGAIAYFMPGRGVEAMEFVSAQASVHTIAGGITTFNVDIQKSGSTTMLEAVMNLKARAKQVVMGNPTAAQQLNGTTRVTASEVCRFVINSTNNENVFHLWVCAFFRPLLDGETRTA